MTHYWEVKIDLWGQSAGGKFLALLLIRSKTPCTCFFFRTFAQVHEYLFYISGFCYYFRWKFDKNLMKIPCFFSNLSEWYFFLAILQNYWIPDIWKIHIPSIFLIPPSMSEWTIFAHIIFSISTREYWYGKNVNIAACIKYEGGGEIKSGTHTCL